MIRLRRKEVDLYYTGCPACGSLEYGSSFEERLEAPAGGRPPAPASVLGGKAGTWVRHCHGTMRLPGPDGREDTTPCGFSFPETEDYKYFAARLPTRSSFERLAYTWQKARPRPPKR